MPCKTILLKSKLCMTRLIHGLRLIVREMRTYDPDSPVVRSLSEAPKRRRLRRGESRGRISEAASVQLCEKLIDALDEVARLNETSEWLYEQLSEAHRTQLPASSSHSREAEAQDMV